MKNAPCNCCGRQKEKYMKRYCVKCMDFIAPFFTVTMYKKTGFNVPEHVKDENAERLKNWLLDYKNKDKIYHSLKVFVEHAILVLANRYRITNPRKQKELIEWYESWLIFQ